jgi:hypothetical protein
MNKVRLPDGHDIGIAKLHQDGGIALPNGITLVDCEMTDMKFGNCDVDIKRTDSGPSIDVRCHDGDRARFIHDGTCWYAVDPNAPVDTGSAQQSGADDVQSISASGQEASGAAAWLSVAAVVAVFVVAALIMGF